MSRKIILALVFLCSYVATSQIFKDKEKFLENTDFDQKNFTYGYYLGVNLFDFKFHPNENGLDDFQKFLVRSEPKMGFHAGLIGRWRLNDYFDFRAEPGIYFVQRDLTFRNFAVGETRDGYTFVAGDTIRNVKSTYLDIPVFINLHGARWYNTRPYMQAGVSWMINLQSNEKKTGDNLEEIWRTKTNNFTWQFELGIELYLKWFKLTPAVKGIFFFNNEVVPDNVGTPNVWANSLTGMYTRAFVFSLKFE